MKTQDIGTLKSLAESPAFYLGQLQPRPTFPARAALPTLIQVLVLLALHCVGRQSRYLVMEKGDIAGGFLTRGGSHRHRGFNVHLPEEPQCSGWDYR